MLVRAAAHPSRYTAVRTFFLMPMNPKIKAVRERIENLEDAIAKANDYLESGAHSDWHGFQPLFSLKIRDGKVAPPHKDWVRNVFLPRREKALRKYEKKLDRLEQAESTSKR